MAAGGIATAAGLARGSDAYRMVAETDRQRILAAASKYIVQAPLTITAFPAERSAGGLHDFYSQADYFWPNPNDPKGPYINRDGQSDPENFDEHRKVMVALSIQMPALTAAWILTGDSRFGKCACDHLRAWFVTPETRMNPTVQFAQAIQGLSTGRSIGIIDTLHLVEVARAASFLMPRMLSAQDSFAVSAWFNSYLDWLSNSNRGKQERDTKNNHAMCWALQAAEFAHLVGNDTIRIKCIAATARFSCPIRLRLTDRFRRSWFEPSPTAIPSSTLT